MATAEAAMQERWRAIVVSSDPVAQRELAEVLSRMGTESTTFASVEQCKQIFRRDTIDLVFCDERVEDGDYWDVYGAITRGLLKKPKVILMSRSMELADCEQAKSCGIFAVIDFPCRSEAIELAVGLARKNVGWNTAGDPPSSVPKFDIFEGAPDRDAMWVCVVQGLANAKERMEQIAAQKPGRYFIFYGAERRILAQTETFAKSQQQRSKSRGSVA